MKNKHNKLIGSSVERSDERINSTGEVFTPLELCNKIISHISEETLKNSKSTFIDPSAGNGNFLICLKEKLLQYHSEQHILDHMLYAIELMEDNHKEMCQKLGVDINHSHYVCANALTYDYSFGHPVSIEKFFEDTLITGTQRHTEPSGCPIIVS
jgi:hypothetical protein